ncbi:hypothetical protein BMS3Abin10_01881 [bacterium BMS3Abin10]|nr:hypothetical protein BMS3Abin10_01881 [bacterium BMS3Abin10]GBE40003.1 hypothetical protein BMS3Bbin08_02639 [bacterium BMS3Bbin08]
MKILSKISNPKVLYSRLDVMMDKELMPEKHGLYAWYFKNVGYLFNKDDQEHFKIKECLIYCLPEGKGSDMTIDI